MSSAAAPPTPPRQGRRAGRLVLIGLVVVLFLGGAAGATYVYSHHTATQAAIPTRQHTPEKAGHQEKSRSDGSASSEKPSDDAQGTSQTDAPGSHNGQKAHAHVTPTPAV